MFNSITNDRFEILWFIFFYRKINATEEEKKERKCNTPNSNLQIWHEFRVTFSFFRFSFLLLLFLVVCALFRLTKHDVRIAFGRRLVTLFACVCVCVCI